MESVTTEMQITERLLDNSHNNGEILIESGGDDDNERIRLGREEGVGRGFSVLFGQRNDDHPQLPEYRDAPFAIAFLIHASLVLFFSIAWGFAGLKQSASSGDGDADDPDDADDNTGNNSNNNVYNLSGLVWLCVVTCLISIGISAGSLKVMTYHAETLIQFSLIGSCCFMALIAFLLLVDGAIVMGVGWIVLDLLTVWYTKCVWNRIPFAAANLRTALSAIQTNAGVCVLAYGVAFVSMIWTVIWFLAFIGVSIKESSCSGGVSDGGGVCNQHMNVASIMFLILSFFWTSQVLKNVLHVTVSGTVGQWWFDPQDALSVFSPTIVDSFRRATTYSFGSICMGSLLVAIIQTLEALARSARRNNRGGIILCIVECILQLISRIAVYFNRWAYCYVGLYGYDYISSGKKAMELFEARGWTTIITDNLIQRTLSLVVIVIGAISGILGMLLSKTVGWTSSIFQYEEDTADGNSSYSSSTADGIVFFGCFLIGISVAQILISVVLSAVDTVIVAFAEAPAEFNTHHPALYNNMVQKWRLVYPEECGF